MRGYLLGLVGGALGTLMVLVGLYFGVATALPEYLPAPKITKVAHLDEKLRFFRHHDGFAPEVLAIGSSITWRQFDASAFSPGPNGDRVLNGATVLLKPHQAKFVTDFYLERYPQIRTIVMLTALPDFNNCSEPPEMFNPEDAEGYAFEKEDEWPFYLKYFTFLYIRDAWNLPRRRQPLVGDIYIDRFGSGPIQIPVSEIRGLNYKGLVANEACIDALAEFSAAVRKSGRQFVVVFAPVNPQYWRTFPESAQEHQELVRKVTEAVARDGTKVLTFDRDESFTAWDFWDAFHLQWPSAQRLSRRIADLIGQSTRDAASLPDGNVSSPSKLRAKTVGVTP